MGTPSPGLLTAATFLPFAEKNTLIDDLGRWAFEEACHRVHELTPPDASPAWSLAVNVSARQFRDPAATTQVAEITELTKTDPTRLAVEVTETRLITPKVEDSGVDGRPA